MDLIHDKANKFINDVRKRKVKIGKNVNKDNSDRIKQDSHSTLDLPNSCLFCEKVFYNSRFLLSHILRRHSEEFLMHFKKNFIHESNNNSNDMKGMFPFLEREFGLLKNELQIVKRTIAGKNVENDTEDNTRIESQEKISVTNKNIETNEDVAEIHTKEIEFLKEKMCNLETNYQYLLSNFKELENILKSGVLMKQDMKECIDINNEKILRSQESQIQEFKQSLLRDLEISLSKQLSDNNSELKSQISELKHEIKQLDFVIGAVKEQVDSPDYMKSIVEKYEQQLHIITNSMKHNCKISKNFQSKSRLSPVTSGNKLNKRVLTSKKCRQMPCSSKSEILYLVNEKLSHFGLSPNCHKISDAEFDEKLKLINMEKEHLAKKTPNFYKIHNRINKHAEDKANLKLHNKKSRKVRFSEIPTKSTAFKKLLSNDENVQDEPYLNETLGLNVEKDKKSCGDWCKEVTGLKRLEDVPESEGFITTGINGGGDYSQTYSSNQNYCLEEPTFIASVSKSKTYATVKGTHEFKETKSPNEGFGKPLLFLSVSEFKTNSTFEDTQESKKSGDHFEKLSVNSMASCSKKTPARESVGMKNTTENLKEFSNHNSDFSDFDDECSLKSLSSWEDEKELPY